MEQAKKKKTKKELQIVKTPRNHKAYNLLLQKCFKNMEYSY